MKARILIAFFLSALGALLTIAPAAAADIKALDLGKAAEVWFSEDHTVPIIAFSISLPAGSGYDPASKAGLATFAAALLDEGAGNMDSRAFQEALASHAIQLSASVELEVTHTEPGVRGDTASGGGNKPATLETGATVNVPLFVNIGDRIKVDTRSGAYMSRA